MSNGLIYIDCGVHDGQTIEFFRAGSPQFLGRPNAREYRIIGFEPDAADHGLYEKFLHDPLVKIDPRAVWSRDGHVGFDSDAGSLSSHVAGLPAACHGPEGFERRTVPCVDFARFIMDHIVPGRVRLVVKLDIESAEYAVLPRLVETGAHRYIDELYVEWHHTVDGWRDKRAEIERAMAARGPGFHYCGDWA